MRVKEMAVSFLGWKSDLEMASAFLWACRPINSMDQKGDWELAHTKHQIMVFKRLIQHDMTIIRTNVVPHLIVITITYEHLERERLVVIKPMSNENRFTHFIRGWEANVDI